MESRTTPDFVTELGDNEIFVFGSNLSGIHGAGAAQQALIWGAVWGNPFGIQGRTYAIPTKDKNVYTTLPLDLIKTYVDSFIEYAKERKEVFLVTEIGCGLAGYVPFQIAPLFMDALRVENIHLPERFWLYINQER
jgi:hypothetical protein